MPFISRERKFWIIRSLLLPVAMRLMRAWLSTCRVSDATRQMIADVVAKAPSGVVCALHGDMVGLLVLSREAKKLGRQICVMTSPSRDGQLQEDVVVFFGLEAVKGSSRKRAVEGTIDLIEAIREGKYGLLAVDGPKGPIGVPKAGFSRIAEACKVPVITASMGASRYFHVGKPWDRLWIPLPFSKITTELRVFPLEVFKGITPEQASLYIQEEIRTSAQKINAPLSPFLSPKT